LPLVEAPAGLDTSILQAARDAQRNLPVARRIGRAISWAGSYAMRPQMAMAALLVLMLGSSIIFLRSKPDRSGALSRVSVTERGVPEQAAEEPRADLKPGLGIDRMPASAKAKRDDERGGMPAPIAAAPTAFAAPPGEPRAFDDGRIAKGAVEKSEGNADMAGPRAARAPAAAATPIDEAQAPNAAPRVAEADKKRSEPASGALGGYGAGAIQAPAQAQDAYAAAIDLFNTGRYAEAEKAFDAIAASGSKESGRAALYAARSAYHAFGCGKALRKYEAIYAQYGTSSTGPDGLMGAADCYAELGNFDTARDKYNQLRSVAGYRASAEDKIKGLQQQAMRRVPAQKAAAPAKPAAPPAQAAPKATSTDVMK
jgi:hypothetical protein